MRAGKTVVCGSPYCCKNRSLHLTASWVTSVMASQAEHSCDPWNLLLPPVQSWACFLGCGRSKYLNVWVLRQIGEMGKHFEGKRFIFVDCSDWKTSLTSPSWTISPALPKHIISKCHIHTSLQYFQRLTPPLPWAAWPPFQWRKSPYSQPKSLNAFWGVNILVEVIRKYWTFESPIRLDPIRSGIPFWYTINYFVIEPGI